MDVSLSVLQKVIIKGKIKPEEFLKFVLPKQKKALLDVAEKIRGKRVVHINAAAIGGGVAEILQSLIPYLRSLGIESDWYVINPLVGKDFFEITNKFHNSLQGANIRITSKEWGKYKEINEKIAKELEGIDCDVLVINDPQPLLAGKLAHSKKHKVYISHIDTSTAHDALWGRVYPLIQGYHRIIFSNKNFVHGSLSKRKVRVFTPAIDPLAPKQKLINYGKARRYLKKFGGIPAGVPLVVQVSRFDMWKNPIEVIGAFRIIQSMHPGAHLALVGFNEAKDNPAAVVVYKDVRALAHKDPSIHLYFEVGKKNVPEFTNMVQNGADIIVQNSIKEGFGLVVSEAMWKSKPVVGGPAFGIRKQIVDGHNGFIVTTPQELANKILLLLNNEKRRNRMGKAAREVVIKKFLFPRLVFDHLRVYLACLK
ncbi:MAG: glycosyltransferase [Parcubacteria group bacterium]|nr:glycosyltransferase [Parcubacteria group bacterium]